MHHYTYFITNEDGMKYIGVRSCVCLPKKDVSYWGSSKHLPVDIRTTGVKEIIETFDAREDAMLAEVSLHCKWNVGVNPWFYNKAKATSSGFSTYGVIFSKEARKTFGQGLQKAVGEDRSDAQIKAAKACAVSMTGRKGISCYGESNPMFGKKHSEETLSKMRKPRGISAGVNMSRAWKPREIIECPHCGKHVGNNYTRWHGDNCKLKEKI